MIRSLIDVSLRFRRLIVAVAIGLMIVGVPLTADMRTDLLPEFSPTTVEVQTEALGLSAEEVEQFITVPLEQDLLNGIAFIDEIESASLPGLSSIVMTFEPGTDPLDARQVVAERLTLAVGAAGLPQVADLPQMLQPLSSVSRVAMISMASETQSQIEQSVLARWVIVPRLMAVEGVANVSIWGFRDRQLQVLLDPATLSEHGVSMNDVVRTTGNALEVSGLTFLEASSPGTGGFIDTPNQRLHIFHEQAINTPEELAEVVLDDSEGRPLIENGQATTLGDVTTIVEDHQPLIGDATCAGESCVLLVVEKFPEANTPDVAAGLGSALEALRPGLGDIQLDSSIYEPASYLLAARGNLSVVLLAGALLVLLMLAVVEWRTAVVVAAAVTTSLAAAIVVLYARGATLNTMVIAGLATGLVVVVVHSVSTARGILYRRNWYGPETAGALLRRTYVDAAVPVRSAPGYAFLVVGALLIPFFFMEGHAGAFFPPIALTYLLTVGAELLVGSTVASAVAMSITERQGRPGVSRVAMAIRTRSAQMKEKALGTPRLALAVFAVFVVVAVGVVPTLDVAMAPDLAERDVVVDLGAPAGTSLPRMNEIAAEVSAAIEGVAGVAQVTSHVGRAIRSDQVANVNTAQIWVNMDDDADRRTTLTELETVVAGVADVDAGVATYSSRRVQSVLTSSDDSLTVRVYGDDASILAAAADEVRATMSEVSGVADAQVELPTQETAIEVEVDVDRAAALGLKPGDVRRSAAMLVSGITVGNLFERQKVFDVVVWGEPSLRSSVEGVQGLPILLPDGGTVALGDVADVRQNPNPTVIRHESVQTYLDVRADVIGRDLGEVASEVDAALADLRFELGYRAAVLGGYADAQAATAQVTMVAVAAVIVVLLLLQSAFGSWRMAVIALAGLPLALSGGILMIRLAGGEIDLGATAGLLALLALGTLWTVTLVRSFHRRRRLGDEFGPDLVAAATEEEIVSGVLALASALLVVIPMAVAAGATGLEVIGRMAIVVIGGLVTTALLAFYVVPAAYLRWGADVSIDTDTDDLFTSDLRDMEKAVTP